MPRRTSDHRSESAAPPATASPAPGEAVVRDAGRARAARDAARDARGIDAPATTAPAASRPESRRGVADRGAVRQGRPSAVGGRRRAVGTKVVNAYVTAVGAPDTRIAGAETPPSTRNKIHSLLSALPVIMLIAGLWLYYSGERAQSSGSPILAQSVASQGLFRSLSMVKSGGEGRHYLWFDDGTRERGARIRPEHREALEALAPGERITLDLAPTVSGSSTLWAWRVRRDGVTLVGGAPRPDR